MSTPPPPMPPPPPPTGGPAYAPGYIGPPQGDHPRATVALVLGILGIVVCTLVAPFALVIGRGAMKEIDASNGAQGGRGMAQAGYILGLIGTILLALAVLVVIAVVIAAAAGST